GVSYNIIVCYYGTLHNRSDSRSNENPMTPHYWQEAITHLSRKCPTMKALIARYEGEGLRARGEAFYTLIRAIAGQQISV
ncbi:hypothetical protein ACO1KZ_15975, partial [Staphylococcus aureus]